MDDIEREYRTWEVHKKERLAKQAADNIEIARDAAALSGTVPEFREKLVTHLKSIAGADYEFSAGTSKTEYTQISQNGIGLNLESKGTVTATGGEPSVAHISCMIPWSALASAEITYTQDTMAIKNRPFEVKITTKDKSIAASYREEGKPEQASQEESEVIYLGTAESSSRMAVMLLRRAAGITNVPVDATSPAAQENALGKGAIIQIPATEQPTNTVTLEVIKSSK